MDIYRPAIARNRAIQRLDRVDAGPGTPTWRPTRHPGSKPPRRLAVARRRRKNRNRRRNRT